LSMIHSPAAEAAAPQGTSAWQNIKRYLAYKWKEIKKARTYYLFVLPYALIFFTFTVIPVIISIYLSFTTFNMIQVPRFVFIENYYKLFMADELFLEAIKNTMLISTITGPVGYLLCLMFAWLLNEMPPKFRAVLTLLFYAPALTQTSTIFTFIFSGDAQGLLNSTLLRWTVIVSPVQWLANEATILPCILVVILWLSLGTSFLSFIAGFQGVDREQYEAGAIDGIKNRWQELWYITLPNMKQQMMFGAVMSITGSFGMGAVITQLVGFPSPNYAAHTIVHHLEDYGNIRFEMGYASAIATILFLIMVTANKLVQSMLRKVGT
jgi:multiple sugar transport system permease protein